MSQLYTYYYIPNHYGYGEPDIGEAYEYQYATDISAVGGGYDDFEARWLVEEIAKDWFCNRDGWEIGNSWNGNYRDFALWDTNKQFVGVFEVMLEFEPSFSAYRKDK